MDTEKEVFSGELRSFHLVSNNSCNASVPEPNDVIEQHLSIDSDGCVWISYYQFSNGIKYKKVDPKQIKLSSAQAKYILKRVQAYFRIAKTERPAADAGKWTIELINESGEKFRREGPLTSDDSDLNNISEVIRFSMNMSNLLCFDAANVRDRIERIKIDYHRSTRMMPAEVSDGEIRDYAVWEYDESLEIDRKTETIEHIQRIGPECDVSRKYHVGEGVSSFLDDYEADTFLSAVEGNPDDVIEDPLEEKTYRVTVTYQYAEPKAVSGSYDKKSLPTDWPELMDNLWEFMRFYGMGEIMNPHLFGKVKRRRSDYMFVFVIFEEYGKEYSYLCNDDSISEGDLVVVPVGNDGKTNIASVIRIEYRPAEEAPYPMDKIKSILRPVRADGPDCPR